MNHKLRERVSIDLQGLKAPLMARAQATGMTTSEIVRKALEQALDTPAVPKVEEGKQPLTRKVGGRARLCLRMDSEDVQALRVTARRAGLSAGDCVAGLVAGAPVLTTAGGRSEQLAMLATSNAQLSGLSRNIHALTRFLTLGNVPQALVYRDTLRTLDGDIRRHLKQAAALMADLRPHRASVETTRRPYR
jgi:hypothetical protein